MPTLLRCPTCQALHASPEAAASCTHPPSAKSVARPRPWLIRVTGPAGVDISYEATNMQEATTSLNVGWAPATGVERRDVSWALSDVRVLDSVEARVEWLTRECRGLAAPLTFDSPECLGYTRPVAIGNFPLFPPPNVFEDRPVRVECGRVPYTQGETCKTCQAKPGETCPLERRPFSREELERLQGMPLSPGAIVLMGGPMEVPALTPARAVDVARVEELLAEAASEPMRIVPAELETEIGWTDTALAPPLSPDPTGSRPVHPPLSIEGFRAWAKELGDACPAIELPSVEQAREIAAAFNGPTMDNIVRSEPGTAPSYTLLELALALHVLDRTPPERVTADGVTHSTVFVRPAARLAAAVIVARDYDAADACGAAPILFIEDPKDRAKVKGVFVIGMKRVEEEGE